MAEVPVSHRPRVAGQSKYGLSRTFRVILDLMTILFLRHYGDRPMHFGALGIVSGGLGFFTLLFIWCQTVGRFVQVGWMDLMQRQLVTAHCSCWGVLLSIIGVQF